MNCPQAPALTEAPSHPGFLCFKVSLVHHCISYIVSCSDAKSCPTPCNTMDCSLPGVSVLHHLPEFASVQFSSVAQSCPTVCNPMDCSMPGLHVHHQLLEFTQTHIHWVGDAIQPSHPLSALSPPVLNLSQRQGLFQWVSSSHQVAKVLEFQLQHQSFQWIFRTDLL